MVLKRYCPAVSQSWIIIFLCPSLITFWPYSRPTVQGMLCLKLSQQKRLRKEVLPTPESPIRIIFTRSSQFSSLRICYKLQKIQNLKYTIMPKLKGKEVKDYVFGNCLAQFEQGSEVAQAIKTNKLHLTVYGISNHLIDANTFPIYNEQIVGNANGIYPAYYEIVRSQNFLYMIFEQLTRPHIDSSSYEDVEKFVLGLRRLLNVSPYKLAPEQIFSKANVRGELCVIVPYTRSLQKANNIYSKFHNKSILAQLFCQVVSVKDPQKVIGVFVQNIESNDIMAKLTPYLKTNSTPKKEPQHQPKQSPPYQPPKQSPIHQSNPSKSIANKLIKSIEQEYPDIDQKQYEELMTYVHVNPSLKQEAGQAYMRQSVQTRQEQAGNQINEIVKNVNTSLFNVTKYKNKDGKSKVEIKLNKKKEEISEFQVHFQAHYAMFKLFKNAIRSYLEKYRNGFAGIIAAYLLTLIGILRRLKLYTDLDMGLDIYQIGGSIQGMNFEKYTDAIKKQLANEARTLANLKTIIQNANMPYKTYEALMPYLEEDLQCIRLEETQNFCFFYMAILMRMNQGRSYHEILAMEVMYILISPLNSIVYSAEDMPTEWDSKYYELKKILISTLVPKWQI